MSGVIKAIEEARFLDGPARAGTGALSKIISRGDLKNALTGKWLGHPVHPTLTDLPIGFWSSASVLDLLGGRRGEGPARTLTGLGIAASVPTAVTGFADWADTIGAERRVGLVHAVGNLIAMGAFCASFAARVSNRRGRGAAYSLVGMACLGATGYLGGHLSYRLASGVDRTALAPVPDEWTPVLADKDLGFNRLTPVRAGSAEVLLYRDEQGVCAIHGTCSHRGAPLAEGELNPVSRTVVCPWHDSEFSLCDGSVVHGPASAPQPRLELRVSGDKIEVRSAR